MNFFKREVITDFSKKFNVVSQGKNSCKQGKNTRFSISF